MGQVITFPGARAAPEFNVVLSRITLNSRTKYMVRVLRGDELVTDDLFRDTYSEALQVAADDLKTMATTHKQPIGFHDRVANQITEVKP